jgi:signal transduction histidine kinase
MFLSSLTNRIFLAAALLVVLAIGSIAWFVSAQVTAEAEAGLQRGLVESAAVVGKQSEALSDSVTLLARLIADLPKLKAAVATGDPPTVQPLAVEYQQMLKRSGLVVVTDRSGRVLANAGPVAIDASVVSALPSVRASLRGVGGVTFWSQASGILQVLSVPIFVGRDPVDISGSFSLGIVMDADRAAEFKALTGSDIAFGLDGRIRAATMPAALWPTIERVRQRDGVATVASDGDQYLALAQPLTAARAAADADAGPFVVVLRSRTEQLRFLGPIQTGIGAMVVVAILLATIVSYAVARTVTRPLAAITAVMRDVAATGDLARRIPTRAGAWEDEDARVLASTFNLLTASIAAFEREAAQRERHASLGRLSSVVAHEIRNPLMIIKTALRTLRKAQTNADARAEAIQDIDEEVARLNRIVSEVLDYAKPLSFEWQPTDVNDVCRESAQAVEAAEPGRAVTLALDADLPALHTDAERLRTVLVNVLSNAAQAAAAARASGTSASPHAFDVECGTESAADGRVVITVRDSGAGIDAALLPRVFEPYFTTRRAGTGLGLAIARNIVDGLGGTIAVSSTVGEGTAVRIELPRSPAGAAREAERG